MYFQNIIKLDEVTLVYAGSQSPGWEPKPWKLQLSVF